MISQLLYLGATHKTAAVAVREQLAAGTDRVGYLLDRLKDVASERLVLSTCGRFELYLLFDAARQEADLENVYAALGLSNASLRQHFEIVTGEAAARRAVRVAAGLESRIVGEHQILGQVRRAFVSAHAARAVGPILSALFRSALHTGKRVRHETSLGRLASSFAGLAVDAIRKDFSTLADKTVVIFGTGAMGREAAALLAREPGCNLIVVSGHADRAAAIAAEFGGRYCSLDSLPNMLANADALICCATARWGVVEWTLARRPAARPLTIIDLGVPRNVAPSVGRLPAVRLIDIDSIYAGTDSRGEAVEQAEYIVEQELRRFLRWVRHRQVAPQVAHLAKLAVTRSQRRAIHRAIVELKEGAAA